MAVLMREILKKWYKHVRFISGIPNFQTHPDDFSWLTHPDTTLPPVTGLAGIAQQKRSRCKRYHRHQDTAGVMGVSVQQALGTLGPWGPGADLFALFQSWNDDILAGSSEPWLKKPSRSVVGWPCRFWASFCHSCFDHGRRLGQCCRCYPSLSPSLVWDGERNKGFCSGRLFDTLPGSRLGLVGPWWAAHQACWCSQS